MKFPFLKQNLSLNKHSFVLASLSAIIITATLSTSAAQVSGLVSGFGDVPRDDVVDGAVVIPSMRASEIISFQLSGLLGPSEEMSVGPIKANVPGNLFFPNQKERYGILPITIKKELFNLNLEAGVSNELVALRFQAPFSKAADLARNKAPYTELVPLVSLKNFSLGIDQDWSRVSNINLPLNRALTKNVNYRWNKTAPSKSQFDLLLAFQQTPASKWVPTDLQGKISNTGSLQSGQNLQARMKVLFARVNNNAESDPESAQGWFFETSPGSSVQANGLPPQIEDVSVNANQIRWKAFQENGWMAVLRGSILNSLRDSTKESPKSELELALNVLGDFGMSKLFEIFKSPLEDWIDPSQGSYTFTSPRKADEKVTLIFVGTDRPVPAPSENEFEPALFTFASQMRMQVIK